MTVVGGRLKDAHVPFGTTFLASAGFVAAASALLIAVKPLAASPAKPQAADAGLH
jgi:hypothetical protein